MVLLNSTAAFQSSHSKILVSLRPQVDSDHDGWRVFKRGETVWGERGREENSLEP